MFLFDRNLFALFTLYFACFTLITVELNNHLIVLTVVIYLDELKPLAKITKVGVAPCVDYIQNQCNAPEGQNNTISIEFTPTVDIEALTTTIHAKIGPIWVPYPLPGGTGDACKTGDVKINY